MKKVFMEPELKVTKFEYENIMDGNIDMTSGVIPPDESVDPGWED